MGDTVAAEIMRAIAENEEVEPADLGFALADYVDTDAISRLADHDDSIWMLTFTVPDHEVTVTSEGDILVDKQQLDVRLEV
jgi:hypothetical protein